MAVWLGAITIITFFAILIKPKDDNARKKFFVVSAIILVVLMGCRNAQINYGSDLNNYYRLYDNAIGSSFQTFMSNDMFEKGYMLVNFILAKIIPWPQFMLFAQSAFCVGVYFYFIEKNTKNVDIAMLSFLSFGSFQFFLTGFRQSIAICIGLLMFEMAKKKKWLVYIILYLLAISFHNTAVVLLPIYLLVNLKNTFINNAFVLVGTAILVLFSNRLFELGNDLFDRNYGYNYQGNTLGGLVPLLIYTIILILCFVNKEKFISPIGYVGLVRLLILGAVIYLLRYNSTIMERISMYFTVAAVPLISENLNRFDAVFDRRIYKLFCFLCCLGLFFWRVSTQYGKYVFFWQ